MTKTYSFGNVARVDDNSNVFFIDIEANTLYNSLYDILTPKLDKQHAKALYLLGMYDTLKITDPMINWLKRVPEDIETEKLTQLIGNKMKHYSFGALDTTMTGTGFSNVKTMTLTTNIVSNMTGLMTGLKYDKTIV